MTVTTIKVETEVRDRLATVARARGVTMATLLRDVSSELESRMHWEMIEAAYARLQRDDPSGWSQYLGELQSWDSVSSDLGDAAQEWPEYNR